MDRFRPLAVALLLSVAGMAAGLSGAHADALTDQMPRSQAEPPQTPPLRSSKLPVAAKAAIERAKVFRFVMRRPDHASGQTLILLHGSGGDETTLLSLAAKIAPNSVLMGVAGRVTQDGKKRWYERITPVTFVQDDVRSEADAFADFITRQAKAEGIDLDRATFVGYSNGANLLAALTLLHPGIVERAVLLRPMPVLDKIPAVDIARTAFLTVVGATDTTYAPFGPALQAILRERGARVDAKVVKRDHGLGDEDAKIVAEWLANTHTVSLNQ